MSDTLTLLHTLFYQIFEAKKKNYINLYYIILLYIIL